MTRTCLFVLLLSIVTLSAFGADSVPPAQITVTGSADYGRQAAEAIKKFDPAAVVTLKEADAGQPPAITLTGDLVDAQRIYAATHSLKPRPALTVEVQFRKERQESVDSSITSEQIGKMLEQTEDPLTELVQAGVRDQDIVFAVAFWDAMQVNPDLPVNWRTMRDSADFYGVKPEVPPHEVPEAMGWRQLAWERRAVKVVFR